MASAPYASFLDTTTDLGGQSHAAWNENGVLLHAVWDPVAGRWGDAAQIANATSARNIQLTPGRTTGSDWRPLLLASWESGEANNADLFLSVGFYEGDGRVVWSDVLPIRANGQADRNHRVGVALDGAFLISNEVRQDTGDPLSVDAAYQDSEIATTELRVTRRQAADGAVRLKADQRSTIPILELAQGERLLRVQANGQWFNLVDGQAVALPRLGELKLSAQRLEFSPDPALRASQGSVRFTFEQTTTDNLLRRGSFEVFGGDSSSDGNQQEQQSYQLQFREPRPSGGAFETQPIGFSQAINRERITRDAFASLVPRRGGSGSFRELAGDGLFGDRAAQAVGRRLSLAATPLLAQAETPLFDDLRTGDGAPMDPLTGPSLQATALTQAETKRYQQTYRDSFTWGTQAKGQVVGPIDGSISVGGTFFDRYELRPGLQTIWNITFEDISKAVDGATFPIAGFAAKLGSNFQISLSGSTNYLRDKTTVGYRSRLSLAVGNAIQYGDSNKAPRSFSVFSKRRNRIRSQAEPSFLGLKSTAAGERGSGLTIQAGGLFGVPYLQRVSLTGQTIAKYKIESTGEGTQIERDPAFALWSIGLGATFGKEIRWKLAGGQSFLKANKADREENQKALGEFTLLQLRASATATLLFRGGAARQEIKLQPGQGSTVLDYKTDLSSARLSWMDDTTRIVFNSFYWANVVAKGVGAGSSLKTALLPGSKGSALARTGSGVAGVIADVPWIVAFGQGIKEVASGESVNGASAFLQFDGALQLAAEASLFNRTIGAKASTGLLLDLGVSGIGKDPNFFASLKGYFRLLYTLLGIDYTIVNAQATIFELGTDPEPLLRTAVATAPTGSIGPAGGSVRLIDYVPTAVAALGPAGLNPALRPEVGGWRQVDLVGEAGDRLAGDSAAPGNSGGRLVRAVIVLPEASAFDPADLNPDGSLRELRLLLSSPGALQVVIDRRSFSAQPLAYGSPQPWQELLRDGNAATAERPLSAVISGARPGDRIPVYIDRRAELDAAGQAPELLIGLSVGASGRPLATGGLLEPAMPDSPTLSQRQGSSYVLGVQDIPRPQGASQTTTPYLAGLLLQSAGSGYRGNFDFVIDTGAGQGAQARALISPSEAGFIDALLLVRPGEAASTQALNSFRQTLETTLRQTPFAARLASGSDARVKVIADEDGTIRGLNFGPNDQGSGYLGGGSGNFYQRLDGRQLGADRELLFKVAVRDGRATSAVLLSSRGVFTPGEQFRLNNDASGGGQGAALLPVVRDWRLLNLVDEQDIAIGSSLRFQSDGTPRSDAWLTYTQGAPLGAEDKPISSQGARIDQPVRISRFQEGNWKPYALQPQSASKPGPGLSGFNINPVIAELTGTEPDIPDQLLVFSHSDTSMIRSEDDLYLLDQALVRSDLYYSYRTDKSRDIFPAARRLPIELPADVTLGLTNNRPYLTPFDNTGGARINPAARDLPQSVLLAWLSSSTPQSFDDDVTIAVTIGTSINTPEGRDISWSAVDLIDPGDGISNDDIVNLSLTTKDGLPVLSWSVLTEQPYRAQVLEDEPLQYLRLDEPTGSDSIEALGALAGSSGQLVRADRLAEYSSPLPFQLVAGDAGTLQSLDDGVLWDAAMGVGDPNQAMRFRGGEFLELANPLAVQALQEQESPSGYGVDLWIRPQADGQGRLLDGSILDAGLYNPAARLPVAGSVTLAFELVRQAAENELGQRGWRYVLQLAADSSANLSGASSSGLSPYNLASLLQAQTLRASFGGVEQSFDVPELLLNGAVTYQTRGGALSNLFSGPAATPLWEEFRADAAVNAEQVLKGVTSEPVRTNPLPLRFEQIQGWSLRQQNGELVFSWGESAAGAPLELRSTALRAGDWNHVQIGYGFVDTYAELNGNTVKRASLVINGQLEASADDLGTERFLEAETLIDYAGFDFNALPLQLGYGYRGDVDELALFNAPLEDLARSSQARQASRFVDPRSASQATFFSSGRWDGSKWNWGDPEKYTYSAYLGASEPSVNRRANGQQVIDIAGTGLERGLRADGLPDAARKAVLPRDIPLGSRLTGIRIETDNQVFAVGDGIRSGETISGLVGVVANNTPTNALLNDRANPALLDLPVLAPGSSLRLFYGSQQDYLRGIDTSLAPDPNARVTYFYRDPQQQLQGLNTPKAFQAAAGTAAVIKNPSKDVLERGSSFFAFGLEAKAIVVREAPTKLADINSGFQVSLAAEPTARNRYADQLEVGKLAGRPYAAILNSQADLEGGSSILLFDLTATSEADLQKLRKLDAGEASVASDTRNALQAAGVKGLRISTAAGQSIGSTLLWADLEGTGQQSLIIGNPEANRGNGEVWILSAAYLKGQLDANLPITLTQNLPTEQAGNVRCLQLPAGLADLAGFGFGTSLAFGILETGRGPELLIGAPGQTSDNKRRDGAVWRMKAGDLFNRNIQAVQLASGADYASSVNGQPQESELEFGTTLALAYLEGKDKPATLLVGLPGLEATYGLRNGGNAAASQDQLAYYREVLRTTAPRNSEPPASETVTVQAGGVLALDLRDPSQRRQVLVVGETFGGEAARAGEGLASGGSFDGGTADDVAIGLPEEDNGAGAVALLRGEDLKTWLKDARAATTDGSRAYTRSLVTSQAMYIHGVEAGNRLGRILRLDGNLVDVAQSGYNELVIGDPQAADGTGELHVISGRQLTASANNGEGANLWLDGIVFHELAVPDPEARLTLTPGRSFAGFGSAVALANVNGTPSGGGPLDDLVMASSKLGSTLTVLYGKENLRNRDRLDLRDIASGQGLDFTLSSQPGDAASGASAFLADINGDGYGDALLGQGITSLEVAYGASTEAGASHPDAGTGGTASLDFEPQLTRLQGRVVPNLPANRLFLQALRPQIRAVQAVGDLGGDGASELLIRSGYRDRLLEGETLGVGESLVSANGKYILSMQFDGNLVLYTQITGGARRMLFSLDGGKLPGFRIGVGGGSTLQINNGQLNYVRPGFGSEELKFDSAISGAKYQRQNAAGTLEQAQGTYNKSPSDISRGDNFAFLLLQDDGNLVAYGKPEGIGGSSSTVYFALQAPSAEIQQQAISGAAINAENPAAAQLQTQSLLFSGAANSNAGLAAGQVLESIEIAASLRETGLRAPGAFIGTLPLNGQQTLLFAHPDAGSGVSANQLLLASPNPDYRERYSDTAGLLRAWGNDVNADAGLRALIEQIVAAFTAPAGSNLDARFEAALANTDRAVERLAASDASGGLGLDFQHFLARQVPLYRLEGRTLLDPETRQPLQTPLGFSLADLDGDGSKDLLVDPSNLSKVARAWRGLNLGALSGAEVAKSEWLLEAPAGLGIFNALPNLTASGDVDGDGSQDLIGYTTIPVLITAKPAAKNPDLREGIILRGATIPTFPIAPFAGDVNGDGVDDFLITGQDGQRQGFWIVYGITGGFNTENTVFGPALDLGRKVNNLPLNTFIETLPDWSLTDLRGGVDVNGDGLSDVQVSLRSNLDPTSVRSYLLFGGDFTQGRTALPGGTDTGVLMQSINLMGTIGFDSLRGTPAGETAIGREGDDLLNGQGGPDVLNGGPGNDVAIVADDQFRRVDGGPGEDALLLNGFRNQAWDLTRLASGGRLANLETIDISDFGANALRLNTAALLAISDSRRILTIEGDAPTRAPLQQLMVLLGKENPRFASEFDAYLDRKGITDEKLRVANDGADPGVIYGKVVDEFQSDYFTLLSSEKSEVFAEFSRRYGPRFDLNFKERWSAEVVAAYDDAISKRVRPDFSLAQRDSVRIQLQQALQRADTVLLADGPNELRLNPNAPDLVLGSDRYWVYEALNGAARLLVADGIRVLRSAEVGTGLIPTPWTQPSTAAAAPAAPLLRSAPLRAAASGEPAGGTQAGEAQTGDMSGQDAVPALFAAAGALGAEAIPVARARPEDQDFSVDTPVVSDSEKRITFTVQRTGYLDETSRLAFRVLGYTAGLVPAGYGQVVFAPGETRRTLQVPIIALEAGAEQLASTEVSVELIPLEPGSAGPRRTASYAINGLDSATETVADAVRPLPAALRSPAQLLARGVGLPLASSLTSRERTLSPESEEVVFGLSSLQGPGASDVWLQTRDGDFRSIYDPALSGDVRHLQDSFEEQDGDLFIAVRDGGLFDGDGQRNGTVDLTTLPVLSSPGVVLLDGLVLRAPGRADGSLWLELAGVPAELAGAELLFVPVLDQVGSLPSGEQSLRPSDDGYREALAAWIANDPAALRRVALAGPAVSRGLELQADTDYRAVLRGADGSLRLPAIRETQDSQGRFLRRLRLEGEGVDLGLELSSNRSVMAGVAGADPLLLARYEAAAAGDGAGVGLGGNGGAGGAGGSAGAVASGGAGGAGGAGGVGSGGNGGAGGVVAAPLELALLRSDGLSGGFDSDGDGAVDLRPGDVGYLDQLAQRLGEPDGAVILSARQGRALLPFTAGDALLPLVFEGISAEAWRQLPAEQRSLSGPGWRLWIDGQDASQRKLQRQGVTRWQLADGGVLEISQAPVLQGGLDAVAAPTRRSLGGAERERVAALGYSEAQVSDRQLDLPAPLPADGGSVAAGSWATLDTQALAGRLWSRGRGLSAGVTAALLDLTPATPEQLPAAIGPWGRTTARFYALHGQAYDTVSLSGPAGPAQALEPRRLTLAARPSLPRLTATATGLSLLDGNNAGPALGAADLSIRLRPQASGPRLQLLDRTYYLLADGAESLAPAGADPASPSRQLLEQLGVPLFQTSRAFDQYFDPEGSGSAETGLFRSSQQLPLGSSFRLVALEAGAGRGELLRPLQEEQVADPSASAGPLASAAGGLSFAAADGTRLTVELASPAGAGEFLARDQGLAPLLNNQGNDQPMELELAISREASLQSSFGFHRVLDAAGTVRDPLSGALLRPGDKGYGTAALSEANRISLPQNLQVGDRNVTRQRLQLAADTLVAPFARVETGETFFAYAAANAGGFTRFRTLGDNRFGYEDLPQTQSDLDYDDAIFQFTPSLQSTAPV